MKVYVLGNPLVKEDNMPLRLLPKLKKTFSSIHFRVVDPTENFIPEEGSVILDTIDGFGEVTLFTDVSKFQTTRSVTLHDFDLMLHLQLLIKLHKVDSVKIIGLPVHKSETTIYEDVRSFLLRLEKEKERGV